MYLFPAIDLRNGQVVRLHQGDYGKQTTYGLDPVAQALSFQEAGCTWLHLVDLDGAREGTLNHLPIIREICAKTRLKLEVGGGVRSAERIDLLLDAGVARVVLGTAALEAWDWFRELVHQEKYRGRVVLGLDAKSGLVATRGWEKLTDRTPFDIAKEVTDWPLAAIVYTDIATDGTLQGPNYESTLRMAESTRVPVVASGGVGTLEHLEKLRGMPLQGVIVGRALYEGRFDAAQARATLEQRAG